MSLVGPEPDHPAPGRDLLPGWSTHTKQCEGLSRGDNGHHGETHVFPSKYCLVLEEYDNGDVMPRYHSHCYGHTSSPEITGTSGDQMVLVCLLSLVPLPHGLGTRLVFAVQVN